MPLALALGKGHKDAVKSYSAMTRQIVVAENRSHIPLRKRAWRSGENTYLGGKRSNLTSRIVVAKHHSRMPLGVDLRTWWKYSLSERSTPTIQIITVEHRCRILLRKENKGAVKILLGRGEVHADKRGLSTYKIYARA